MTATELPGQEQLADQVARYLDANDLRRALAACEQLNRAHPGYAYGWYLASYALKRARRFQAALEAIDCALGIDATPAFRLHKAKCQFESRDLDGARATANALRDGDFDDARLHEDLGSLFNQLTDYPAALRHFSRAVDLDSSNAEFRFNQAALLRYLGDAQAAERAFDAVIALKPDEFEAYNARAQVRTQTADANHVEQLQDVLARTSAPAGYVQLCYALAKELEDLGDHEGSFASLALGARAKRRLMRYEVETDLAIMAKIREIYGPDRFDGRTTGCDRPDPIFIVGMPRTGTTLVERILDRHSQVCSAGELNEFSLALVELARRLPGPAPTSRTDFVAATERLDFRALGEAYLERARPMRDARPYFIDKLPFNFLYAGLIHLALPRARIINLRRHPMDTCYAVFKQLFRDAYPYSYDLEELGRYYVAYDRLMQHWNAVMPGVMLTVSYENVVADLEGESRRILEHCELPWEDACLQFHRSERASTTASALQVRQPVYDTSVGKWRRYEAQLEPLRVLLERGGIATGAA